MASDTNMPVRNEIIRVFVSYAREDKRWLDPEYRFSFVPFLMESLRRQNVVFWFDQDLRPGDEYKRHIESEIDQADIALLIVSQNFLNSEFIDKREMPRIAERAQQGKMVVIPVLVEPCDWSDYSFLADRQMVPSGSPLVDCTESEAKWAKVKFQILEGIKAQLKRIHELRAAAATGESAAPLAGTFARPDSAKTSATTQPAASADPQFASKSGASASGSADPTAEPQTPEALAAREPNQRRSQLIFAVVAGAAILLISAVLLLRYHTRHAASQSSAPAATSASASPNAASDIPAPVPFTTRPPAPVNHSAKFQAEEMAGLEAASEGKFDVAASHFRSALQIEPESPQEMLYLGASLYDDGGLVDWQVQPANVDPAISALNGVLVLQPNDGYALRQLAEIYYEGAEASRSERDQNWRFGRAKITLQTILKYQPRDFEAEYTLGAIDVLLAGRNAEKRLEPLGLSADDGYPQADTATCQAIAATNVPLLTDAVLHLNRALVLNPRYEDALLFLKQLYQLRAGTHCSDSAARSADLGTASQMGAKATSVGKESDEDEIQSPEPPSNLKFTPFTRFLLLPGPPVAPPPPPPPPSH